MSGDSGSEPAQRAFGLCGEQIIAQVPGEERGEYVQQAGQDDNPGRLKVEVAAPTVLVRKDVTVARGDHRARGRDGNSKERLGQHIAGLSPVEARMRDDDS